MRVQAFLATLAICAGGCLSPANWVCDHGHQTLAADLPEEADRTLVHVVLDLGKKEETYAVKVAPGDTVRTVVGRFSLPPPKENEHRRIWVARPNPPDELNQILMVAWDGCGAFRNPVTNYPIQPGDQIYVKPGWPSTGTKLACVYSPWELFVARIARTGAGGWEKLTELLAIR